MATRLVASLLLGVFSRGRSNDGVAAFNVLRATVSTSARRTVLSLSPENDSDTGSDVLELASTRELCRRSALSHLAAAAATIVGAGRATAAEYNPSVAQFSAPPTSGASSSPAGFSAEANTAPKSDAEAFLAMETSASAKGMKDFDGNEAGPIGVSDEGSQPPTKGSADDLPRGGVPDRSRSRKVGDSDPSILETLVGSVDPVFIPIGLVGALALLNKDDFREESGPKAAPGFRKGGKKLPTPYGFDQGRNYWEDVDMAAARRAGFVIPPPPKTKEQLAAEAAAMKPREKPRVPPPPPPSWALPKVLSPLTLVLLST